MSAARSFQGAHAHLANRPRRISAKELLGAALALVLVGLLAALGLRLVGLVGTPAALLLALAGLGLGILLTDFISGLVHWLCDTYGDEQTRLLGPLLIAPFREHHRYPQRMVERSFVEVNLSNSVGAIAVIALAWVLEGVRPGPPTPLGQGFLLGLAGAIYLTNTFHQWAHHPRPPRLARLLQSLHLAIDPRRHARHHAHGYGAFCITTGWLNPLLDRCEVFPRSERALGSLCGRRPEKRKSVAA